MNQWPQADAVVTAAILSPAAQVPDKEMDDLLAGVEDENSDGVAEYHPEDDEKDSGSNEDGNLAMKIKLHM